MAWTQEIIPTCVDETHFDVFRVSYGRAWLLAHGPVEKGYSTELYVHQNMCVNICAHVLCFSHLELVRLSTHLDRIGLGSFMFFLHIGDSLCHCHIMS